MYTVLGATGHIGSVIARVLLEKGEKVRIVGRSTARLQPLVQKGAEPFIADVKDAAALARAFTGVRAAFLMMPQASILRTIRLIRKRRATRYRLR